MVPCLVGCVSTLQIESCKLALKCVEFVDRVALMYTGELRLQKLGFLTCPPIVLGECAPCIRGCSRDVASANQGFEREVMGRIEREAASKALHSA
jgi:hypothetical protein